VLEKGGFEIMRGEEHSVDKHDMGAREKRFGTLAVQKGFITPDQLIEALKIQINEEVMTGKHTPIGRILFNQNLITFSQLTEVVLSLESNEPMRS
jgi:hypothetical protein